MSIFKWIFGNKTELDVNAHTLNHKEIFENKLKDLKMVSDNIKKFEDDAKKFEELIKKCLLETEGGCDYQHYEKITDVNHKIVKTEVPAEDIEIVKDFINTFKKDCIISYIIAKSLSDSLYVIMLAILKN